MINVYCDGNKFTIDSRLKQIRLVEKNGGIEFKRIGEEVADSYEYLYKNDKDAFKDCLAEDLRDMFGIAVDPQDISFEDNREEQGTIDMEERYKIAGRFLMEDEYDDNFEHAVDREEENFDNPQSDRDDDEKSDDPQGMQVAHFNRFEIEMTLEQAESCSHQGECDSDVEELLKNPEIKNQLEKISPEDIKKELKGYGSWDEEQLSDEEENYIRILWIAAGNISDEYHTQNESVQNISEDWQGKLQDQYENFEEFESYCETYGIAKRLGYDTPEEAWEANPTVKGSINPEDYKKVDESISNMSFKDFLNNNIKDLYGENFEGIKESSEEFLNRNINNLYESGEMGPNDIEEGGEYYEAAQKLKSVCEEISNLTNGKLRFKEIRPFDKYQGPYALVRIGNRTDKVWFEVENDERFYIEHLKIKGTAEEIAKQLNKSFGKKQSGISLFDRI